MSTAKTLNSVAGMSHILRLLVKRAARPTMGLLFLAIFLAAVVVTQGGTPLAMIEAHAASASGQAWANSSLPGSQVIQHVVIIFQENRSPDNLFQDPALIKEGADIQSYGINSKHQKIILGPRPLDDYYDMGHGYAQFVAMYDGGKMDGADKIAQHCDPGHGHCKKAPPDFQFKYVQPILPPSYMATNCA